MCWSMAAKVVDFQDPVVPETSTIPRGASAMVLRTGIKPNSSNSGISVFTYRMARARSPLCPEAVRAETQQPLLNNRKKINLSFRLKNLLEMLRNDICKMVSTHSTVGNGDSMSTRLPSILKTTGFPTLRCTSEAPPSTAVRRMRLE